MNNGNEFDNLNLPKKTEVNPEELVKEQEAELVKVTVEENKGQGITIPQEYYDKIAAEQNAKKEKEKLQEELDQKVKQSFAESKGMLSLAILNAIVFTVLITSMIKINSYIIYAIPAYMIISSIISVKKNKEQTTQPTSTLIGGVIAGAISFLLSMIMTDKEDLFIYYTFALIICGIIGLITSSLVTYMINDKDKVKAMGTICILVYFIALFGTPYILDKNFHEKYYKYVFRTQAEVKATTEKEFIEKTLNSRYNVEFTCEDGKRINNIEQKTATSQRKCTSENNEEINVTSIAYKESEVLYVVEDDYMDVKMLSEFKNSLIDRIKTATSLDVDIAMYPEDGCSFVGDCHDCDEYTEKYSELVDLNNMYNYSTSLNLEKEINMKAIDYVNNNKFKYIVELTGKFSSLQSSNYENIVSTVLEELNESNIKNNYGFEVIIENSNAYNKQVYKVIGESSNNKFEKYTIVE